MKRIGIVVFLFLIVGALLLSCSSESGTQAGRGQGNSSTQEPRGRISVQTPDQAETHAAESIELETYTGTLTYDDPEWYLDTEGITVALHLGNRTYLESLDVTLEPGMEACAKGVMEDDGLEVTTLTVGDQIITLRDTDGRPSWAGSQGRSAETTTDASPDSRESTDSESEAPRGQGRGRSSEQGGGKGRVSENGPEVSETGNGRVVENGPVTL